MTSDPIARIVDANINRCGEALRVLEEYFRFVESDSAVSIELKTLRHLLEGFEAEWGREVLLANRDTGSDCFADEVRSEELGRQNLPDVLRANARRAQESARVLEEYSKVSTVPTGVDRAKKIRFAAYALEKKIWEKTNPV